MPLTTGEKITFAGVIVAVIGIVIALMQPEVRSWLGLENSNKTTEKVKNQPSSLTNQNSSNSSANNSDSESFSQLQQTSAQEVIGRQVIATDFEIKVNESNTIITIPFKLKDEDASSGTLYGTKTSYLADPNGKLYNIIREEEVILNNSGDYSLSHSSDGRTVRQHEIYHHKLIFQKLESKPQFLYFHYNSNNNFPPIKLMLNWVN